jgi:hypothetical protein
LRLYLRAQSFRNHCAGVTGCVLGALLEKGSYLTDQPGSEIAGHSSTLARMSAGFPMIFVVKQMAENKAIPAQAI